MLGCDDAEADAWSALEAARVPRGDKWDGGPLGPTTGKVTSRPILAGSFVLDRWTDPDNPRPLGLLLADDTGVGYTALDSAPDGGLLALAAIAARAAPGCLVVFWKGASEGFHVFCRHIAPAASKAGWRIQPLAVSTSIRAILVSQGRTSFTLCDSQALSGASHLDKAGWLACFGLAESADDDSVLPLYRSYVALQQLTRAHFGVALSATVGMLAVKAFRATLPAEPLWLRPPGGLVAMCRAGGAYRGGATHGESYQGPGWKVDCNKLYTWALAQGLPRSSVLGKCFHDGREQPGIYLCRVKGESPLPVRLSAWNGAERGYRKQTIRRVGVLTCLPHSEFEGLRALGLDVEPVMGYRFVGHVDTSQFTGKLFAMQTQYSRGTAQHLVAKMLGNALVGKLGEKPDRLDLVYSESMPDESFWPYLSWDSRIVPGLWVRQRNQPAPHQRVDAAAHVTALGRSHVYTWLAEWLHMGGRVVHLDTDGEILSSDPTGLMPLDARTPGAFRSESSGEPTTVLGAKLYANGQEVHTSGLAGASVGDVWLAFQRGQVSVGQSVLLSPWESQTARAHRSFLLRRQDSNSLLADSSPAGSLIYGR